MCSAHGLRSVVFSPAGEAQLGQGVLGYVALELGELRLDGLRLRRLRDGRLALCWPYRRDATGRRRYFARPWDEAARSALERAVLAALAEQGLVPALQPVPCLMEARWHSSNPNPA